MQALRDKLEHRQIAIYFGAVALALIVAGSTPATTGLATVVNPALAFMLFVTFLQVPLAELGRAFTPSALSGRAPGHQLSLSFPCW